MQGYGQFCPVAKALEVVGRRWTLLILRELLAGARRFSEVQRGVPLMSRTLLAQRLHELEIEGLIVVREREAGRVHEYALTAAVAATQALIEALGAWGGRF